jgi:quinol monooxygenase YgiN
MAKIAINAFSQVKPEKAEELKEQLAAAAEASRKEPGNVLYIPTINLEDPTKFHVFEVYEDVPALQAHAKGPALAALKEWLGSGVLVAPFTIEKHALVAETA